MYKTGNEKEKQKEGAVSHDTTGETQHRFVVLYNVCRGAATFFSIKELYGRDLSKEENWCVGWLKGKTSLTGG
jgi:hypothetical protein